MIQRKKTCNILMLVHNIEVKFFMKNEKQEQEASEVLDVFNKKLEGKIQTNISKIKNYCKAEEYHQKYIEKNR